MIRAVKVINPISTLAPDKLRVAAYCRVSSDSEDQQNSFLAQVNAYTELISANPEWELVDIYADDAITGTRTDKRIEFQRLLKDCRSGKIDRVITKAISRFARNTRDCLECVRSLRLLGVTVLFQKENIDTAVLGDELMLNIFSSLAQEESLSISKNMRWSYQRRIKSGDFITCRAPFGYRLVDNNLYVDEVEAQTIRHIFSDYLSGIGKQQIADKLTCAKVQKRDGNTNWNHMTITRILCNEKYAGNVLLQKTYKTESLPFKQVRNRDKMDKYYVQHSHPAIISQEDFDHANELNSMRNVHDKPPEQNRHALSRKIICGSCGHTFRLRNTRGIRYWVCAEHKLNKSKCPIKQIPESDFYSAFMRMYTKLKHNYRYILQPLLDGLIALNAKCTASDSRIGDIDKEIALLNEQNHALNRLRSKGYMDSAFFMEQSNQLAAKVANLRKKRRELANVDEDDHTIADLKRLIEIMDTDATIVADFDTDMFAKIVDKIIVTEQDKLTFRLLGGVEFTETVERIERCSEQK